MISINKNSCCACGACEAKCPTNAIKLCPDENGNYYPHIDFSKCINCCLCEKVCPEIGDIPVNTPKTTYAVRIKDNDILLKSASGGASYAFCKSFIDDFNGVVYGCSYNDKLVPIHMRIATTKDLLKIQGSKYVRSTMTVYDEIKKDICDGKQVLFIGTPCQCAAIKKYVSENTDNLYTVELICHGVIDIDYWCDYIKLLEKKYKIQIDNFVFRSKRTAKPFFARITGLKNGKQKTLFLTPALSYYYFNFLSGSIFRENCYECKYANKNRIADITIGDFWGYNGVLDNSQGVSVAIINSAKGENLFNSAKCFLEYEQRTFDEAAKVNEQLRKPFSSEKKNYDLLTLWKNKNAEFVYRKHKKKHWKAYIASKFGYYK